VASVAVKRAELFPAGTVVKAYKVLKGSPGLVEGKPAGAVVAEGTVEANGELTVNGLTEGQEYVLAAEVTGAYRYLYVLPTAPPGTTGGATVNIETFGGSPAHANNTPALNEAINALPASGGEVYIPAGEWGFTGEISALKGKNGVRIRGAGGRSGSLVGGPVHQGATSIFYNGAATARFLDLRNSYSCSLVDINVFANSKAFGEGEGIIVDWSGSQEPFAENVTTESTGTGEVFSAYGWYMQGSNSGVFINCAYKANKVHVLGRAAAVATGAHKWYGGFFVGARSKSVLNPGLWWSFFGCVFEPLGNAKGETTNEAGAIGVQEALPAEQLDLIGCWLGGLEEKGSQIEWTGKGLRILGGTIGAAHAGVVLFGTYSGIEIATEFAGVNIAISPSSEITGKAARIRSDYVGVATQIAEPARLKLKKVASPAAELAALKTAVDALREACINAEITLE
jgi:hypothetical protein